MMELTVDSLIQYGCQCNSILHCSELPEKANWFTTISFGDALTIICTLVGLGVAILQYRHSSKESREQAQRNQRETWFLQVIVLPQLENVNDFYKSILKKLEEDRQIIISWGKNKNHNDYLKDMAEIQEQRKAEINTFFDHISALVKSYNKDLGQKVDDIVMDLEDIYVRILEQYGSGQDAKEREEVLGNMENLVAILNSGISEKQLIRE